MVYLSLLAKNIIMVYELTEEELYEIFRKKWTLYYGIA